MSALADPSTTEAHCTQVHDSDFGPLVLLDRNFPKFLTELDKKPDLNVLYQVCVFRDDRKTKMSALADPSTKVAHCTQLHDSGPYCPLFSGTEFVRNIWIDGYWFCQGLPNYHQRLGSGQIFRNRIESVIFVF